MRVRDWVPNHASPQEYPGLEQEREGHGDRREEGRRGKRNLKKKGDKREEGAQRAEEGGRGRRGQGENGKERAGGRREHWEEGEGEKREGGSRGGGPGKEGGRWVRRGGGGTKRRGPWKKGGGRGRAGREGRVGDMWRGGLPQAGPVLGTRRGTMMGRPEMGDVLRVGSPWGSMGGG